MSPPSAAFGESPGGLNGACLGLIAGKVRIMNGNAHGSTKVNGRCLPRHIDHAKPRLGSFLAGRIGESLPAARRERRRHAMLGRSGREARR